MLCCRPISFVLLVAVLGVGLASLVLLSHSREAAGAWVERRSGWIRWVGRVLLSLAGGTDALRFLVDLAEDPDREVRLAAIVALGAAGGEHEIFVLRELFGADADSAEKIIYAIGHIGGRQAKEFLFALLDDDSEFRSSGLGERAAPSSRTSAHVRPCICGHLYRSVVASYLNCSNNARFLVAAQRFLPATFGFELSTLGCGRSPQPVMARSVRVAGRIAPARWPCGRPACA